MIIIGADADDKAILVPEGRILGFVVVCVFELGGDVAVEVGEVDFGEGDAFGAVEHGEGGDVVGPAGVRGEFVGFVGFFVFFEDL